MLDTSKEELEEDILKELAHDALKAEPKGGLYDETRTSDYASDYSQRVDMSPQQLESAQELDDDAAVEVSEAVAKIEHDNDLLERSLMEQLHLETQAAVPMEDLVNLLTPCP